ncbi:MAG: NAD-dependent epimerase/dehydratase family protein [Bacteroidota bacterium]
MKVLVTGAAGFIGSHTSERLLNLGFEVIGLDNFCDYYSVKLKEINASEVRDKGGSILKLDLRDDSTYDQLPHDIDYIIHFAAQPGISQTSSYEDYLSNNVEATKKLVDFALTLANLKLFVNIGTSSIYGLDATYPESYAPEPASYYGVTKLAAEQLVLQKTREKQMMACSLRLYSVIGPRERPEKLFTKLIDLGLKDQPFPLFDGSEQHLRSFTYVGDIVDGIVSVIGKENDVNGEVINLGTEKEYTTQEGIDAVAEVIGKPIKIDVRPKRAGDQFRTRAIIGKAKKLLDYNPTTNLKESVAFQVAWFQEQNLSK